MWQVGLLQPTVKGVPGTAIALDLNYDNLISEDIPELSQLSNTVKIKQRNIYVHTHIHMHIYILQAVEL